MMRRWMSATQHGPAEIDGLLLWSSIGLLLLGLVMVYSSSISMAEGYQLDINGAKTANGGQVGAPTQRNEQRQRK